MPETRSRSSSLRRLFQTLSRRCGLSKAARLPPMSLIQELLGPRRFLVAPPEVGRRLPPEEESVSEFLRTTVYVFSDRGHTRSGVLDAETVEKCDLAGPVGLSPKEAIERARAYLIAKASHRKGGRFLSRGAYFRYRLASYVFWECDDDPGRIRYRLMGRWSYRIRSRLLRLLGWEEISKAPDQGSQRPPESQTGFGLESASGESG
jgi:hypothetical protein